MAADGALKEAILFGGNSSAGLSGSTQRYDYATNRWTTITGGATPPSPRAYMAMAGDPATGVVVMFGGETKTQPVTVDAMTWKFSMATGVWTRAPNGTAPAARADAAFAVDPSEGIGLLFGGLNPSYRGVGVLTYSDTWEINLTSLKWTNVTKTAGSSPPPLRGSRLAWDPNAAKFDLVGGCFPCSTRVWQFDPSSGTWGALAAESAPPPGRMDAVWSWDPVANVGLLFGGTDGTTLFNDTYLFEPTLNDWVPIVEPTVPAARASAAADWLGVANNATLLVAGGTESAGPGSNVWRLSATANVTVTVSSTAQVRIGGAFASLSNATTVETSGLTNASGQVTLTGVPPAPTTLNVSAPGYTTVLETIWIPSGGNVSVNVTLPAVAPAIVEVHVVNGAGDPISEGATVSLLSHGILIVAPALTTNAAGWANYTSVPAGYGDIQASAAGYRTAVDPVDFASGENLTFTIPLGGLPELHILTIGIVGSSAIPLRGVSIYVNDTFIANTSSNGWLNTSVSENGLVEVVGQVAAFDPGFANVTVPTTGFRDVTLTLLGLPLGTLQLNVVDASNSTPLSHANTTVESVGRLAIGPVTVNALANHAGQIDVPLVEGNYTYTVSAPGYVTFIPSATAEIISGNTTTLRVALIPNLLAEVHFLVLDRNTSLPIANASVTIAGRYSGATDLHGWLNLSQISPGINVSVISSANGYVSNLTHATFTQGEADLRFPINLTELPHTGATNGPSQNVTGLSFSAANAFPLWELLLIPAVAAAGAVLYLFVLRVPTVPGIVPPGRRPPDEGRPPRS